MTKKTGVVLLKVFLLWRGFLFLCGIFADRFLLYAPSFPYSEIMLQTSGLPRWLYSWGNFDGVHYVTIADLGYIGTGLVQAFFPVYPFILLHLPKMIWEHFPVVLAGLLFSNLAALALAAAFFTLARQLYGLKTARLALATLFLFPTAFFFGAMYTESLFFLFVITSFLAAYHRKWWIAGILALLASGTRLVGICLVPALAVELFLQAKQDNHLHSAREFIQQYWQQCLAICLGSFGLLAYMAFLQFHFADPLYFLHVQTEFGAGRAEQLVLYPQVVWRSIKILFSARPFDLRYFTYVQEAVVGIGGLIAILWSARKVRISFVTFSLLAFMIPTFTGTFSSMGRYVIVCLSIWLGLGDYFQRHPKIAWLWLITSTFLLIFNTILFIQGYWVA